MKLRWLVILLVCLLASLLEASHEGRSEFSKEQWVRLRQGEVLSEGGYLRRAVWGKMAALIMAPPAAVWEIFVSSDDWHRYGIPRLIDSRIVAQEVVRGVSGERGVEAFYEAMGSQRVPLDTIRRHGGQWTHYAFQYYNIPWPVANRWLIVETRDDEREAPNGNYRADWTLAGGNLKTMTGSFDVSPFEGDPKKTLLRYQVETNPGSHVPRFLMRWGVKKIMPAVVQSLRREAAKRYHPGRRKAGEARGPVVQIHSNSSNSLGLLPAESHRATAGRWVFSSAYPQDAP